MSNKINQLSNDLSGFFTNSSETLYDFNKSRNMSVNQRVMYHDKANLYKATCLSFYNSNTPAIAQFSVGSLFSSFNIKKAEKGNVKIRFIEGDEPKNGFLTKNPLDGNITEAERKILIELAPTAVVTSPDLMPNHQDIMIVSEGEDGKYYIEKIVGNLQGITPAALIGGGGLSAIFSQGGAGLLSLLGGGPLGAATSLGDNQALHYTPADRINQKKIKKIMLHSTAGSTGSTKAQACINFFGGPVGPTWGYTDPNTGVKNPPCSDYPNGWPAKDKDGKEIICHPSTQQLNRKVYSSIHYATDQGGNVVQGVLEKDIAHHYGRGKFNAESIGIEMCGHPGIGPGEGSKGLYSAMYTDLLIDTTAKLVAEICKRHSIPVDRKFIRGHDEHFPKRRCDPGWILNDGKGGNGLNPAWGKSYPAGNYWNWDDFMSRVQMFHSISTVTPALPTPPSQTTGQTTTATSTGQTTTATSTGQTTTTAPAAQPEEGGLKGWLVDAAKKGRELFKKSQKKEE